jgi:hypothetical protein
MNKDEDIRISTEWEAKNLSEQQKEYVALDAFAHLALYQKLQEVPEPGKLPEQPLPGLLVSVYQEDGQTLIAYGQWSHANSNPKIGDINITKTRAAIDITKVIVKGAILKLHNQSLESFGQPPFTIVCKCNQLQTSSLEESEQVEDTNYSTILSQAASDYQLDNSEHSATAANTAEQSTNVVVESWLRDLEGMDKAEILKAVKAACINDKAKKLCESIFQELSGCPYSVIVT